jgi:hypothetical protein
VGGVPIYRDPPLEPSEIAEPILKSKREILPLAMIKGRVNFAILHIFSGAVMPMSRNILARAI